MIFFPKLGERIQAPSVALPNQAKNGREIIGENDKTEPAAVNQPCGLEDLLFLLNDDLGAFWGVCWDGVWVPPRSAFVDLQELLGDILDVFGNVSDRKPRGGSKGARTL